MRIESIHERELPVPVDELGRILETLAGPDGIWPIERWPNDRIGFDQPLAVGAEGGHGPIRYTVVAYEPGRRLAFEFEPDSGLRGRHSLEGEPAGSDASRMRHVLDVEVGGIYRLLRPVFLAMHDALVEDLLDKAELAATGQLARPAQWPRWLPLANRIEVALRPAEDGSRPSPDHDVKLPNSAHTSQPWRIHEIAPDFRLEDVWALPTPGGPDDFPRLVRQTAGGDTSSNPSRTARTLFAIRWKLGELFGWDDPDAGVGSRVPTLRDRLPADLRDAPAGPGFDTLPFSSVYLTYNEWAAEIANRTVHGVLHMGWVPDGAGGYRGQMAVLVKPNGLFGRAYMAAIAPFRHLIVYPPLMRDIGRAWQAGTPRDPAAA